MFNNNYKELSFGYSMMSTGDLEALHDATLTLMGEYGVRVFGNEAHEYYRAAGCEVDAETNMVRFPKNLVNDCIESAPAEYTMYGRTPENDLHCGGKNVIITNFTTGIEIQDIETGERRETTLQDLCDITRFIDGIPEIQRITLPVAATDVEPEIKELYEAEALFNNTSKHFSQHCEGKDNIRRYLEMAALVAGGADKLKQRPIISSGACPNSPLELHETGAQIIIEMAKAGVPVNILSMGLCGGTTPVTLAGTILVTNCEILAGIVLSQLAAKGAPVCYGSSTTIMDLKLATSPVGAPEHAMVGAAVSEIGKYYGIPTYVGGT